MAIALLIVTILIAPEIQHVQVVHVQNMDVSVILQEIYVNAMICAHSLGTVAMTMNQFAPVQPIARYAMMALTMMVMDTLIVMTLVVMEILHAQARYAMMALTMMVMDTLIVMILIATAVEKIVAME